MKILLIGGTGAMGAYLVRILSEKGHDVIVTSRSKRTSDKENVHYLQGDAHDPVFRKRLIQERYDAVVDFLIYGEDEFKKAAADFAAATKQYVFLSSSRVYADSKTPITEDSPRLLEVSPDKEYLKTSEYALKKAREENILKNLPEKNWTIIRPYITYSNERLQLGVLEKEQWLYRALKGKTIVFSRDIAEKYTTLTFGYNVAEAMAGLIGNPKALGEAFHIAGAKAVKWEDVLKVYKKVLTEKLGAEPRIFWQETSDDLSKCMGNWSQIHYDRLYDRIFDNSKAEKLCSSEISYQDAEQGLEKCLREFIDERHKFREVSVYAEAYMDKLTGEHMKMDELSTWKQKIKYVIFRYTPYLKIRCGCKFE